MSEKQLLVSDDWSRNWNASVAVKMTSVMLWVIVTFSFVLSIIMINSMSNHLKTSYESTADRIAYQIATQVHQMKPAQSADFFNKLLTEYVEFPYVEVFFNHKKHTIGLSDPLLVTMERLIPYAHQTENTHQPEHAIDKNNTIVLYHQSFEDLKKKRIAITFIEIGLVVLAFGFFHAWMIGQMLEKPFEVLENTTKRVSDGDFSVRLDANRHDEFGRLATFFNHMLDGVETDKARLSKNNVELKQYGEKMEFLVQERTAELEMQKTELANSNQELAETLKNLEQSQQQLILSEKMASLGQLIAGIAHEINTPAAAIQAAANEIDVAYLELMEKMIHWVKKLPVDLQEKYLALCQLVLKKDETHSTKLQRETAREIKAILIKHQIENAHFLSKQLSGVGVTVAEIDQVMPVLAIPESDDLIKNLNRLGMTQTHVRDIKVAITRISHMMRALKSYSHLDTGEISTTHLQEDLDNTLVILNNKIKRAITVHKSYDPIPVLHGYPDKLNQIWTNLIHNAIQAMRGAGDIYIRVKQYDDDHIMIEVEDSGIGMPADILTKIFEPHFTTKDKGEGTGLGLAIVKEIVDLHKGQINVTSKPGKTVFSVILPIKLDTK